MVGNGVLFRQVNWEQEMISFDKKEETRKAVRCCPKILKAQRSGTISKRSKALSHQHDR